MMEIVESQRDPEPLNRFMREEAVRWLDVVRKAKIRLDP